METCPNHAPYYLEDKLLIVYSTHIIHMSKSITITLPNAVADSLDRFMTSKKESLTSGERVSKSDYVAKSVRKALEHDGVAIIADNYTPASTDS